MLELLECSICLYNFLFKNKFLWNNNTLRQHDELCHSENDRENWMSKVLAGNCRVAPTQGS